MVGARAPRRCTAAMPAGLVLALLVFAWGGGSAKAATAGFAVTNTPTPSHAPVGQEARFDITVTNNGQAPEQPSVFVDDGIVNLLSASVSCPGATNIAGSISGGSRCQYPALAPGESVTMSYTATVGNTSDSIASDRACVAPVAQDTGSNFPETACATGTITIDPNLTGMGYIAADLAILSITPSVDHAGVGDWVTFTIAAKNYGRDAGWLFVNTMRVQQGFVSGNGHAACGRVNQPAPGPDAFNGDGSQCEYGLIAPDDTVVDTVTAQVRGSDSGYATDTACTTTPDAMEVDPGTVGTDCQTAVVKIDQTDSAAGGTTGGTGSSAGGSRSTGPVVPPQSANPVATHPGNHTSSSSNGTGTCPTYTRRVGHRNWRYRIRRHERLTCGQSRRFIHRADRAFRPNALYANVRPWSCVRELQHAGGQVMWLVDCAQRAGQLLIWTEQRPQPPARSTRRSASVGGRSSRR
jgi:Domain of unknown function DUF11